MSNEENWTWVFQTNPSPNFKLIMVWCIRLFTIFGTGSSISTHDSYFVMLCLPVEGHATRIAS